MNSTTLVATISGAAALAVAALSYAFNERRDREALEGNTRMLLLGVGIGVCFWLSAFHVLWNAEGMAVAAGGLTRRAAVSTDRT